MILNFNCDKVISLKDGAAQNVLLTKTNKKVGAKDTITNVVGKLNISGDSISILISDSEKFDTYTEGQAYNLELFVKNSLTEQKEALTQPTKK